MKQRLQALLLALLLTASLTLAGCAGLFQPEVDLGSVSISDFQGDNPWVVLDGNQPAFTDVSEPEMAKAAQWCVEQGILTAPGETTFRPNGWVTRVKVIQTWNTAFPKQ